jgi:hypothetical protein
MFRAYLSAGKGAAVEIFSAAGAESFTALGSGLPVFLFLKRPGIPISNAVHGCWKK